MKKTLDTRLQPGTVLMICSAGRMVWAVRVDRARDEAVGLVERQHHRADHDGVLRARCAARSGVIPLALRRSTSGAT